MRIGITALIPPEIIYACGHTPLDINNAIPFVEMYPSPRLCAWSAIWRDLLISKKIEVDRLAIVAGGDCHNALVDGQTVERTGMPTHYFFYPMEPDERFFSDQIDSLEEFLYGIKIEEAFTTIHTIKERLKILDRERYRSCIDPGAAFGMLISASDMGGDIEIFDRSLGAMEAGISRRNHDCDKLINVGVIGIPPIMHDFHSIALECGLRIVYDELPWEFIRLGGRNREEVVKSYIDYSFARKLEHRIRVIAEEVKKRKIDALIHYTQYACHHTLEDTMFRESLDVPILTIQGDLPGKTGEQAKLRLEAFHERLTGRAGQ